MARALSASARRSDDDPGDQMMQRAGDNLLLGAHPSTNQGPGHLGQPMVRLADGAHNRMVIIRGVITCEPGQE